MNLFQDGSFQSHSGLTLPFKIDCDSLTDDDLNCLAQYVSRTISYDAVHGIPRGGVRFAQALRQYTKHTTSATTLIVDDVLTTGASMERAWEEIGVENAVGIVIFARGPYPFWVRAIFSISL